MKGQRRENQITNINPKAKIQTIWQMVFTYKLHRKRGGGRTQVDPGFCTAGKWRDSTFVYVWACYVLEMNRLENTTGMSAFKLNCYLWRFINRILVQTSRDMDWTCPGLLWRWQKVCRVYWAIILTKSCHYINDHIFCFVSLRASSDFLAYGPDNL